MPVFKKPYPPEYLAMIRQFRLMDDTFFAACMDGYTPGIELILQLVLKRDDIRVVSAVTQQSAPNLYGRGVRFDVLARDSTGKLYNCEIQRENAGAIPRRVRYNGGLIDSRELRKGTSVKNLPETYIIFITENDFFHAGLPLYHVERTVKELQQDFDDGMHVIYVNGTCRDDTPLGKLMQDFSEKDPAKYHYAELSERAEYFKSEERGISAMCEIMEQFGARREAKGRAEGMQKGIQKGIRENARETTLRLLGMGFSVELTAKATGLSQEEVQKIIQDLKDGQ